MEEYDIVEDDSSKSYYKKGTTILHRLEGPAVEYSNGYQEWWVNGNRHRTDGPARKHDEYEVWHLNDKLHRLDGPAVSYSNGDKYWWVNDKFHRLDGPAIELANGDKKWYINGFRLSTEKETIMNLWYENGRT